MKSMSLKALSDVAVVVAGLRGAYLARSVLLIEPILHRLILPHLTLLLLGFCGSSKRLEHGIVTWGLIRHRAIKAVSEMLNTAVKSEAEQQGNGFSHGVSLVEKGTPRQGWCKQAIRGGLSVLTAELRIITTRKIVKEETVLACQV